MIVKLLADPNIVYESAMLLYDSVNNISYREKKSEYERATILDSEELIVENGDVLTRSDEIGF